MELYFLLVKLMTTLSAKIQNSIEKAYQNDNQLFTEDELLNSIEKIVQSVSSKTDKATIQSKVILFVHCKEGKYYFNTDNKYAKPKEYHNKIDNLINKKVTQQELSEMPVKKVKSVKLVKKVKPVKLVNKEAQIVEKKIIADEPESTSDELEELQNKILSKMSDDVHGLPVDDSVENSSPLPGSEILSYTFPVEKKYKYLSRKNVKYEPFGTQSIYEKQVDDILDETALKNCKIFDGIRAIKLPEQRSPEWFAMRDGKITASDGGQVLGKNHYSSSSQFNFILKKTLRPPFESNRACHHGKKFEDVATIIYESRMNVSTDEFGLIGHSTIDFLGASPDRICNQYKWNKTHLSKYVGRMVEIKCPFSRAIKHSGPIVDGICPIHYWIQVQLQLECCNLEECDFWQCTLNEYESKKEFLDDTDPNEPFRSKETGFEKGCLIQLLPKERMQETLEGKYWQVIYEDAIYIYPPHTKLTPHDYDIWVHENLSTLSRKYPDHYFDKVLYWKLITSKNVLINRDRKWFAENLPTYKKMWDYVIFFRRNDEKLSLLTQFIDSLRIKSNKTIMSFIDDLFVGKVQTESDMKKKLKGNTKINTSFNENTLFNFVDEDDTSIGKKTLKTSKGTKNIKKPLKKLNKSNTGFKAETFAINYDFVDDE